MITAVIILAVVQLLALAWIAAVQRTGRRRTVDIHTSLDVLTQQVQALKGR